MAFQASCSGSGCATALNLHNFHEVHGHLPSATQTVDGFQHSWRAVVNASVDNALFRDEYSFEESWDSPGNRAAACMAEITFGCGYDRVRPGGELPETAVPRLAYVAVVGPECAIRPEGLPPRSLSDMPRETIVLVETRRSDVEWTRPFDLDYAELVRDRAYAESVIGGPHPGGGHYIQADGKRGRINDIGLDELLRRCVVSPIELKPVDH